MTLLSVTGSVEAVRRHLRRRGGVAALFGVVGVTGGVLGAAWLLAGSQGWAAGTRVPLALLLVGGAGAAAVLGWVLLRVRRWSEEGELTGEMERSAQLPRGAVRAGVELARELPSGTSPALARSGEDRLARRLSAHPRELAGRAGREMDQAFRITGVGAGVALVLVLLLGALSPDRSRTAWAGLANAGALAVPESLPPLGVEPGDARLPRGEAPRIHVAAPGRDSVTVTWQGVGEVARSRTGAVREGGARFELPPLASRVTYRAWAPDGARTREYALEPVDPSLLTDLVVEVRFPPHTGIPDEVHRGAPSALTVPAGTGLHIRGELVGEGAAVLLVDEEGEGVARLPVREGAFSGSWAPTRSSLVRWEVEEGDPGAGSFVPGPLEVEVVPDAPPRVALPVPGGDMELPPTLRMPLLLEARDDFGVAWVEVEARRAGDEEPVVDRIPAGERSQVLIRPLLDLSEWGLEPGDEVLLRARAADNAPRAQVAETPIYRLRVPSAARVREDARDRIQETAARVQELADAGSRSARELREMEARARTRPGAGQGDGEGFRAREELRELMESGEARAREVEELRDALGEARESLGDGARDRALGERLRELEELLDRILDPGALERIRELVREMESGDAPPLAQALEELARDEEGFRDRLAEALERLRLMALEAAFEGVEEGLRELVQDQEELAGDPARPGAEGEELARGQEALGERARELEERLQDLEGRMAREGEGDESVRRRLEEGARELSRAGESMARSGDAAGRGDGDEARELGQDAAREAGEALEQVEEARREWMEERLEELRERLRAGAQDALTLARRQGELREGMDTPDPVRRRELLGEMAALEGGLGNLGSALARATRDDPELGRELSVAVGRAMQGMEAVMEGLRTGGGPRDGARGAAGATQEALNRVALTALAAMDRVGEQMGSQAMERLLEELENLAARQGGLNQETASLSVDGDEPGAGERTEELAAGQAEVAGGVEELAGRPGADRLPGSLEELGREAREIAQELAQGRLDPEILERQERLLERLLSAGRTLEREGETDEREGTPAGEVERRAVAPLPSDLLRDPAFPLPTADELRALTPAERRLVLEYFERMNRRRAGGGER